MEADKCFTEEGTALLLLVVKKKIFATLKYIKEEKKIRV